jgi:hypothetical protein
MNKKGEIPQIIWFLWFQGFDNAPLIVQKCFETWKENNFGWQVNFLDEDNLNNFIDFDLSDKRLLRLGRTQLSDLVRLKLLYEYGGVWVDSTCFCVQPLDRWLYDYLNSGFFAFCNPGSDRLMSNWFLAAIPNHLIITKLYDKLYSYLTTNKYRNVNQTIYMKVVKKILSRNTNVTKYWFHPLFTKVLRLYPYYIFHYIFTELVYRDSECKRLWQETPKLKADNPHKIGKIMHCPLSAEIKGDIDRKVDFLYKLNWKKYQSQSVQDNSTIWYLLNSISIL